MFFHLHYVSLATRKATDKEIDHLVDTGVLVVWLIRGFRPVTRRSLHLGADSCSPALNASSCSSCSVCCILIIEVQSLLHPLKALVQGLCRRHSSAQGLFSGQQTPQTRSFPSTLSHTVFRRIRKRRGLRVSPWQTPRRKGNHCDLFSFSPLTMDLPPLYRAWTRWCSFSGTLWHFKLSSMYPSLQVSKACAQSSNVT